MFIYEACVVFPSSSWPWNSPEERIHGSFTLSLLPGSRSHPEEGIYGSLISQKFLLLEIGEAPTMFFFFFPALVESQMPSISILIPTLGTWVVSHTVNQGPWHFATWYAYHPCSQDFLLSLGRFVKAFHGRDNALIHWLDFSFLVLG